MRSRLFAIVALALLSFGAAACSGDDDDDPTPTAAAASTATSTAAAELTPTAAGPTQSPPATVAATSTPPSVPPVSTPEPIENGDVTGTFLEPVRTMVTNTASLGTPEPPEFEAWDRQTVVVYDLESETATNYGEGFFAGFSSDGALFGYNDAGTLTVVDLASGEQRTFPVSGGLASLIGEHYAVLPAGPGTVLDFDTGVQTPLGAITDPELRYLAEQRLRPTGGFLMDGGLALQHTDWPDGQCTDDPNKEGVPCRAELYEQWAVIDLATGDEVLAFRAIAAAPAGPGEIVIATSPRCTTEDGRVEWCEDMLAEMRLTEDRSDPNPAFAHGTTNIFLVDIETGEAQFVATATYNPPVFIWPMNWPLIANEEFIAWTESFCGQPQGKTRIYDRATREITELDVSEWLRWHDDLIGFGAFNSHALVDPTTLDYVAVAPEGLSGIAWSPDLRYVGVGAVLGHGGLCG